MLVDAAKHMAASLDSRPMGPWGRTGAIADPMAVAAPAMRSIVVHPVRMPYQHTLKHGLASGSRVLLSGVFKSELVFALRGDTDRSQPFFMHMRGKQRQVVLNTCEDGSWGAEHYVQGVDFPYATSQRFELQIHCEATQMRVRFGSVHGTATQWAEQAFEYRSIGPGEVHTLYLNGDVIIDTLILVGLPESRAPGLPPPWARGLERASCNSPAPPQSLAVVFAAILEDVDRHFAELLASIAAQTAAPEELVTVVSGTGATGCGSIRARIEGLLKAAYMDRGKSAAGVPRLTVRCVAKRQIQARSRQQASLLTCAQLISYIDADDAMYPRRIEIVKKVFAAHAPKIFLHGYAEAHYNPKGYNKVNSDAEVTKAFSNLDFGEALFDAKVKSEKTKRWGAIQTWITLHEACEPPALQHQLCLHHAHNSIQASIVRDGAVRWNGSPSFYRLEDSKFVKDVIAHFGRHHDTAIFMPLALTYYNQNRAPKSLPK